MKHSIRTGLGFGVTSGVITTLGLMMGLYSGTQSRLAVIGGVLTIAIADAFSDSLGIHISKEFEKGSTKKSVWTATLTAFFSKFFIALTFVSPILIFSLKTAITLSIVWGFLLLGSFSFYIAKDKKVNPWPVVIEHLAIATLVLALTQYAGSLIRGSFFN